MFGTINGLFGFLAPLKPLSGWFVRIPFAITFLTHGYSKIIDIDGFAGMLSAMGSAATPVAILVGLAEVLGGAGAIVGGLTKGDMGDAITRLTGLAIAPVMLGAIFLVHLPNGWNFMNGGMEFQVLLFGVAMYFMINGKKD